MHDRSIAGRLRGILLLIAAALLAGCTDAATRLAYELEAAAKSGTTILRHLPAASPEGCAAAYSLQLSANAGMVIWCKDSRDAPATSSHMTTYHLRYVEVPQTWRVDKAAGEATTIELEKRGGKVVVIGVE